MLNKDQQEFLDHHKIPTSHVCDGAGLMGDALKKLMADGDYLVAINTNPCNAAGHTMKLKAGHCAQCTSQNLGFRKNHYRPGNVYILHSKATQFIKIGSTGAPLDARVKKLNSVRYGNTSDWTLIHSQNFTEAGKVEFSVQKVLRDHRVTGTYAGQSRDGECHELFNCTAQKALDALRTSAADLQPDSIKKPSQLFRSNLPEKQVQRKDVAFRLGEHVRHIKKPDWGVGSVVRESSGGAVRVRFPDGSERDFEELSPFIEKY
jgi:hypothetical protein